MKTNQSLIAAVALVVALTASACGSNDTNTATRATNNDASTASAPEAPATSSVAPTSSAPSTSSAATTEAAAPAPRGPQIPIAFDDATVRAWVDNIAAGYRNAEGIWDGYDLADHPVVLAVRDDDNKLLGALAINHKTADELGDATALDIAGTPFVSAHRIDDPKEAEFLTELPTFEFRKDIGGQDSFVMVAGGGEDFFNPSTADYVSTLVHEMFHRYQTFAFNAGGGQDVEGYDYSKENLELAVLEERALAAAVTATTDNDRDTAARHFAGLRLARLAADPRVSLDNDQESGEGTARFLEHKLGANDKSYSYHANNFDGDLLVDFDRTGGSGIKSNFGFGRWYASGAAVLHLLDELGVEFEARVENGEAPAEILAASLGVTALDAEGLAAEAKAAYDSSGELAAQAAEAEKTAAGEGSVFDDLGPAGDDGDAGFDLGGEGREITTEEIDCLSKAGFDIATDGEISGEQAERCLSGS